MASTTEASVTEQTGPSGSGQAFSRSDLLRWVYLWRMMLVTGILVGALLGSAEDRLVVVVMFLAAAAFTSWSSWYTHVRRRDPGENFLYAEVVLDIAVATAIVHVTGGPQSPFAPLYILVISTGALLLPIPGGVLIGALASIVYFADLVWGFPDSIQPVEVGLQIGLFAMVAIVTGLVGDRLRRAGMALGAVESELRQLRLDTGDILANLATGVLTVDGEGRLAYANPAAEILLGLSSSKWLGAPVMEEVERKAPGMGRVLERAIRDRQPVERFRSSISTDGGSVTLGISTAVLERGAGAPPSATAIFQDITNQEVLEALNRRTERLEAIASLSASLAHEIKNPLASIRSAVEQLTRAGLAEEDRATLQRLVLGESDRLSRLLSEFLDYSGLRMGPRRRVDVAAVARDCVTLMRQHPDAEGVEVSAEGTDGPALVLGDSDLLHRALFNLILNGAQFAGAGGRVVVHVGERSYPRGTSMPRAVAVVVGDSGPGVAQDVLHRIFDPFFTTRVGGTGLGLAVVFRAVQAHGGTIFVDRSSAGGAQFVIYLPAEEEVEGGETR
ncbi:MAG: PAS domain-containing protein [Gemmatimonadetes bacterium]|nr:PAS domain-containing protein [Gemmatimonadota bacterium]